MIAASPPVTSILFLHQNMSFLYRNKMGASGWLSFPQLLKTASLFYTAQHQNNILA